MRRYRPTISVPEPEVFSAPERQPEERAIEAPELWPVRPAEVVLIALILLIARALF